MNKNKKNKGKIRTFLALSVVLVLACLLALNISRYREVLGRLLEERPYQLSDFESYLRNYDYPKVVEMAKKNEIIKEKPYLDVSQYVSFAYFFEAATHYNLYQGVDEKKAQQYKEQVITYLNQINNHHFQKHIETVKQYYMPDMKEW